jgi:hypothetical protein
VPDGGEAEAPLFGGVQEVDVAVAHDPEEVGEVGAENLRHAARDGERSHAESMWAGSRMGKIDEFDWDFWQSGPG